MRNLLKPYAKLAHIALLVIAGVLLSTGFATAAVVQEIVGASLMFGVAFWKIVDVVIGKSDDGIEDYVNAALAAIASILLGLGIVNENTVTAVMGGIVTAFTLWYQFNAQKK